MLAFGIGEASGAFKNMAWGVLLLFYYQQVVGVEAALVGLAIAIAVMIDAVTDPLIGTWSDRIRTRWGRRHPMLLAASVPLAATFIALFNPPEGLSELGNFLWLMVFGVLVRTSYTFYNIPHLALGAEMAHDYDQRSTLFAYSAFIGAMSVAVSYGLIMRYYFPTTDEFDPGLLNAGRYPLLSLHFAAVMALAIVLCVLGTAREIPNLRETQDRERFGVLTVFKEMSAVLTNRSFRALFAAIVLGSIVGGVESAFTPFLGVHFWGIHDRRSVLLGDRRSCLVSVGLRAYPGLDTAAGQAHGGDVAACLLDHRGERADRAAAIGCALVSQQRVDLGVVDLPWGVHGGCALGTHHRCQPELHARRCGGRARIGDRSPP